MKHTSALFRQIPALSLCFVVAAALSGCAKDHSAPTCPNVFALADARQVDHYRAGAPQTPENVEYAVRLDNWTGGCTYQARGQDWDVNVDLTLAFTVVRGPANSGGQVDFSYLAAIPYFYPNPAAKMVVPVSVQSSAVGTAKRIQDGPLHLTIPVHSDDAIDTYTIYLGLQLQPDELGRNRQNP